MIGEIKTIEDIQYLSEAVDFECKQAKGADGQGELPGDFWKTYSAMANTKGGVIALGIKENTRGFELVGIPNINRIKKQLFDILNNPNKVSVNLLTDKDVQVKTLEARNFLLVQIPMAKRQKQPVYINNNPMGNTYIPVPK
jgi:predicted HTH transcriptional regulator